MKFIQKLQYPENNQKKKDDCDELINHSNRLGERE